MAVGDKTESCLLKKRQDLITLVNHIRSLGIDEDSEATNIVLSRLLAEVRRGEVDQMRQHILSCPGISSSSAALHTALPALEEALDHINKNGDKLQSSLMSSAALMNSFDGSSSGSSNDRYKYIPRALGHNDSVGISSHDTDSGSTTSSVSELEVDQTKMDVPAIKKLKIHKSGKSKAAKKKATSSESGTDGSIIGRILGFILRFTVMDAPLAMTCLFLVTSYSAQSIYNTYYVPIMEALTWDDQRKIDEYTNYMRQCDASDVSTLNPDDFIVDPNSTSPQEAVEMTNKHGMTIFPNVVSPETAAAMRDFVLKKNHALTEEEAIWLIANKNRWSFAIGAEDDPSVPPVLREIATNPSFIKTIELLMGEDPAMVELTSITSAYGATNQNWHSDNDFTSSQMHHARSFVPMYSLFVPLQDTTTEMGATSACPGTHLCAVDDGLSELCDGYNFQVSDSRGRLAKKEEDHTWKTGDGYLMNLNTYHRGPGHTDPKGTERVMLIMTISPRPQGPKFETRQISLGTSYSCRWDMWGMTMKDLAIIDTIKGFPWKQLRTLGIYKPMGPHRNKAVLWGWDYLTVVCSRIVNEQFGFRFDDLESFIKGIKKRGKFVTYLFGYMPTDEDISDAEVWPDYFRNTLKRCIEAGQVLFGVTCVFYLIASLFQRKKTTSIVRGVKISSTIVFLGALYLHLISRTPWAKDITSGALKRVPFEPPANTPIGEVTLPVQSDILFSTRVNEPYLAGHNLIYNHQPGNSLYNEFILNNTLHRETPGVIVKDSIRMIREEMQKSHARFLEQNIFGDWEKMKDEDIISLIQRDLVTNGNPILKVLDQEMHFLASESNHGLHRGTAMALKHAPANLMELENALFGIKLPSDTPRTEKLLARLYKPSSKSLRSSKKSKPDKKVKVQHYKVGDSVEGYFQDDGWFKGKITRVLKRKFEILFDDGDEQILPVKKVRRFEHLAVGEMVAFSGEEGDVGVTVKHIFADGRITIMTRDRQEHQVHITEIHRIR